MRNSGWYIPFWRKPKRAQEFGQGDKGDRRRRPRPRSDDDLERVRSDWVARYTSQVRALALLGLSVGAAQEEIDQRYRVLSQEAADLPDREGRMRALRDAVEILRTE